MGPKPAAAGGGSRQAGRRESQGAAICRDYASSPGRKEARAERPGALNEDLSLSWVIFIDVDIVSFQSVFL